MDKVVLVVEPDGRRRGALCKSLSSRAIPYVEAADIFQATAALGRADFGALVVNETRPVSLRGLCRLARKRHPYIAVFVSQPPGAEWSALQEAAGTVVERVHADTHPDDLVAMVEEAFDGPEIGDPETLATAQVRIDVEAALAEASPGAAVERAMPRAGPDPSGEKLVMEGSLDDAAGAALLMSLFAQEATGKLWVSKGPAEGHLYVLNGEPVWAEPVDGDAGLHQRLVDKGVLPAGHARPSVPEGQLLSALASSSSLTGQAAQAFMLGELRDRVLALATQPKGVYRFTEDLGFTSRLPILKVNAFGLILESRRRQVSADRLLVVGAEMAGKYLHPGPGLGKAAPRLLPFTRGIDVSALVTGDTTGEHFFGATGLDRLMGALALVVMVDCHLVTLAEQPLGTHGGSAPLGSVAPPAQWDAPAVPDATTEAVDDHAGVDAEKVLELYFRLQPLTVPAQVLGVPLYASPPDVESAYWQRMRELDARRIPPGPSHALVAFRVEEIKRKLTGAYQQMMATVGPMASHQG